MAAVENCIYDISVWMWNNKLMLNEENRLLDYLYRKTFSEKIAIRLHISVPSLFQRFCSVACFCFLFLHKFMTYYRV